MIYEYMLIREMDRMRAPSWIEDGGYFYNPDNFTLVGWSPDEGVRQYYVPDTVTTLTRDTLLDRVLGINARYPMEDPDGNPMTNEQITAMVDAWVTAHQG